MAEDDLNAPDDETLVLQMMEGDQEALRLVIETYGPRIRAALRKRYEGVLAEPEIDEAMNRAAFNVFRFADRFDKYKGTLRAWFFTIAIRATQDIIRREERHQHQSLEYDPGYDPASPDDDQGPASNGQAESREARDLRAALALLSPGERQVIEEDLASGNGGVVDATRLAEKLGCSKNQVYVWRSRARDKIEKYMTNQGHFQSTQRGKR